MMIDTFIALEALKAMPFFSKLEPENQAISSIIDLFNIFLLFFVIILFNSIYIILFIFYNFILFYFFLNFLYEPSK
jgi:hypothetical protein